MHLSASLTFLIQGRHGTAQALHEPPCSACPAAILTIITLILAADIRVARKELREGAIDQGEYEKRVEAYMGYAIDVQEKVGLDVLVHGEPERSDM